MGAGAMHAGHSQQGRCVRSTLRPDRVRTVVSLVGKYVQPLTHSESARTVSGPTPKILIVDDDPEVRSIVAEFLEDLGYDILQARGGIQALELQERTPDLSMIVTDIRMPDMSGIELANIVTQRRRDLKVILISGYFVAQQVERRFLRKPFRMRDLEAAVREELGT